MSAESASRIYSELECTYVKCKSTMPTGPYNMMTRSRNNLENMSYERSPLPCMRVRDGDCVLCSLRTVCSITIGTSPEPEGSDHSLAGGREPIYGGNHEPCVCKLLVLF